MNSHIVRSFVLSNLIGERHWPTSVPAPSSSASASVFITNLARPFVLHEYITRLDLDIRPTGNHETATGPAYSCMELLKSINDRSKACNGF